MFSNLLFFRKRRACQYETHIREVAAVKMLVRNDIGGMKSIKVNCRNVGTVANFIQSQINKLNRQWTWELSWRRGRDTIDVVTAAFTLGTSLITGIATLGLRRNTWNKRRPKFESKVKAHERNLKLLKDRFGLENSRKNLIVKQMCSYCMDNSNTSAVADSADRQGATEFLEDLDQVAEAGEEAADDFEQMAEVCELPSEVAEGADKVSGFFELCLEVISWLS